MQNNFLSDCVKKVWFPTLYPSNVNFCEWMMWFISHVPENKSSIDITVQLYSQYKYTNVSLFHQPGFSMESIDFQKNRKREVMDLKNCKETVANYSWLLSTQLSLFSVSLSSNPPYTSAFTLQTQPYSLPLPTFSFLLSLISFSCWTQIWQIFLL